MKTEDEIYNQLTETNKQIKNYERIYFKEPSEQLKEGMEYLKGMRDILYWALEAAEITFVGDCGCITKYKALESEFLKKKMQEIAMDLERIYKK